MFHLFIALALIFSSSCSGDFETPDAPSRRFAVRTQRVDKQAADGSLVITVRNAIPVVEVPAPHTATHIHLNAELCAYAPTTKEHHASSDTGDAVDRPRGLNTSRCLSLSPSIFSATEETFVVSHEQVTALTDNDFKQVQLRFYSSSQTTGYSFGCRNENLTRTPESNSINDIRVVVDGQHSLSFNCHKLTNG